MENINDILAKYFSGEATPDEKALVMQWKQEHATEYVTLEEAWAQTDKNLLQGLEFKEFDTKAAWRKVDLQLEEKKAEDATIDKEVKVIKHNFYKKVAAACAILLVGLAGFWYVNQGINFEMIANTSDASKEIKLADGSTVWLASNATLHYHSDFKNHRDLKLEGEAFFEVAKDAEHPFIIQTVNGAIEVLGTGFNVDATAENTTVSVSHGKVALSNTHGEVKLTKGEMAVANNKAVSNSQPSDVNTTSWKTGVFNFNDTPIEEVVLLLNEFYETEIVLMADVSANDVFSGNYDNAPLSQIIESIVLICNVKAENSADVIRLK